MAATVADLTIAYRVMSQPCQSDPVQGKFAISTPPAPSAKKVLGVPREWISRSAPAVLDHFNKVIDYLKGVGYEVIDIKLPYLREGQLTHASVCLTEAVDNARRRVPPGEDWVGLLNHQNRMLFTSGVHTPALDFLRYGQIRHVIMGHLAFLFEQHPGLMIISPTTPTTGMKIHPGDQAYGFTDVNVTIANMRYAWLSNLSGCPSVTCPMGYAVPEQGGGEGKMPMGFLAMGEWGAEEQLLMLAAGMETYLNEQYTGGRLLPEEWVDVLELAQEKAKNTSQVQNNGVSDSNH